MKTLQHGLPSGILTLALGASAWSAEIPFDLDATGAGPGQAVRLLEKAGLPHDEAVARAVSMDRVELAQISRSDLEQKGGLADIVVVGAVALILVLMWIFTVCET